MATDQPSGSTLPEPFAWFDPDSCSWRMCQGSLLEASGESCTTWPRQGTWDLGFASELAISGPLTDASESSSLLPTPDGAVFNDGQTVTAYLERKRRELAKGYNGNGGGTVLAMALKLMHEGIDPEAWKAQLLPTPVTSDGRGLTDGDSREGGASLREIEELLPTPGAWLGRRPENAMADPERAASREHEGTRGKRSLELPDALALLPTPTRQDGENTAGPSQFERNTPPLNAVVTELLPTPSASDGSGGRIDNEETTRTGKRPSGAKAELTLRTALTHKLLPTPMQSDGEKGSRNQVFGTGSPTLSSALQEDRLLPTPVANPDNPGAGGELRAAIEHGPGRRNETGIDSMGRPNQGRPSRLLPTPTQQDARQNALNEAEAQRNPATMWATMGRVHHGDHTSPRFGGGSQSSGEQHPDQLTLEDA